MLVDAETRAKVVVNNNTCNSIDTASYLYWVRVSALALGRATAAPPQWAFGQGQREAALQKYFQVGCKQFGDLVRHLVLTGGERSALLLLRLAANWHIRRDHKQTDERQEKVNLHCL